MFGNLLFVIDRENVLFHKAPIRKFLTNTILGQSPIVATSCSLLLKWFSLFVISRIFLISCRSDLLFDSHWDKMLFCSWGRLETLPYNFDKASFPVGCFLFSCLDCLFERADHKRNKTTIEFLVSTMDTTTTIANNTILLPHATVPLKRKGRAQKRPHAEQFDRRKRTRSSCINHNNESEQSTGPVKVLDQVSMSRINVAKTSCQTRSSTWSPTNTTNNTTDNNKIPNKNTNGINNTTLHFTGHPLHVLIAGFFKQALNSSPASVWSGTDGTILTIIQALRLPSTQSNRKLVRQVLERCVALQLEGKIATKWMVDSAIDPSHQSGRPPVISLDDTVTIECINKAIHLQMPVKFTAIFLNSARRVAGLEPVSESAIRGLLYQLGAIQAAVRRRQQGSLEVGTAWAWHRWGVALQCLIRASDSAFQYISEAQAFLKEQVEWYLNYSLNKDNSNGNLTGGSGLTNSSNSITLVILGLAVSWVFSTALIRKWRIVLGKHGKWPHWVHIKSFHPGVLTRTRLDKGISLPG